jgi:hypothetical protein
MTVAVAIATLVPLTVLAAIIFLGRNGGRLWPLALIALLWGFADTYLVIHVNDRWAQAFGMSSLIVLGAPIAEEITKAAVLPFLCISRRVTWFVDGAVLGAAAGTGFAIRENWVYLDHAGREAGLGLALARVSSTNLMHAGCTAIVGAAIVLALSRGWIARFVIPLGGLAIAIALHSTFNRLTQTEGISPLLITITGVGVMGIAVGIVALGYPISARWVREDLARAGATASEQAALSGSNVAEILDTFESRYGSAAATKAEELVAVQRKLAIAQRSGRASATELDSMEATAAGIRRDIGMFAMMWLRSHLPVDASESGIWGSLEDSVSDDVPNETTPSGLWARLDEVTTTNDEEGIH